MPEQTNSLVDQAASSADNAIRSTQRLANDALDSLAGSVQDARHQATPLLNHVGERASALAQRGVNAARDGSQQIHDRALRVSDGTVMYIKDEPLKAMLMAAAAGAALMALVGLLSRARS